MNSDSVTEAKAVAAATPPRALIFKMLPTLALIFFVAGLDQATKILALRFLNPGEVWPIIDQFFNLTLVFNRGAAFGFLAGLDDGLRQVVLGMATILAVAAVLYFLIVEYRSDKIARAALGVILGGAVGNIIDRVGRGEVVDFLDFYYQSYHWPAFNIADSAICIGVAVLLFRKSDKHPRE